MKDSLVSLRREYKSDGLSETDVCNDPLDQFEKWFGEMVDHSIDMANAMVLATADSEGNPSARYVLLKDYSKEGFVFYTSSLSRKGIELNERPRAALLFYWKEINRQVRIEGDVHQLGDEIADEYFKTRPRGSKLSAWIANQSEVIPDREFMKRRMQQLEVEFDEIEVTRPETWCGYQVVPELYEFWQGQENRLHDRIVYRIKDAGNWEIYRLAP